MNNKALSDVSNIMNQLTLIYAKLDIILCTKHEELPKDVVNVLDSELQFAYDFRNKVQILLKKYT